MGEAVRIPPPCMNKPGAFSHTSTSEGGANKMKYMVLAALGVAAAVLALPARGQVKVEIAQALTAAPRGVAAGAAVVRMDSHGRTTKLRAGTNGWTCIPRTIPLTWGTGASRRASTSTDWSGSRISWPDGSRTRSTWVTRICSGSAGRGVTLIQPRRSSRRASRTTSTFLRTS